MYVFCWPPIVCGPAGDGAGIEPPGPIGVDGATGDCTTGDVGACGALCGASTRGDEAVEDGDCTAAAGDRSAFGGVTGLDVRVAGGATSFNAAIGSAGGADGRGGAGENAGATGVIDETFAIACSSVIGASGCCGAAGSSCGATSTALAV